MDGASEDNGWYSNEAATFGDRVVAARESMGLSEEDLARKLGVKLKTVRNWEQDLSEPRANKLQMLAGVLNVSFSWLLTGEGEGLDAPGNEPELSQDTADLLTELRQLRGEVARTAERIGRVEKRLQAKLREAAI